MNNMKVIDLLNKIANSEEVPKKIKYNDEEFVFTSYNSASKNYNNELEDLFEVLDGSMLNDEVEIIEKRKIPEKLGYFDLTKDKNEKDENGDNLELRYTGVADTFDDVYEKINEIIDYLESKGE